MNSPEDHGSLDFDPDFAATLIGKYILVGVTVEDRRGEFRRNEQFHGTVLAADACAGITLRLGGSRDGEEKTLPPTTKVFESAPRGTYTLRTTGEKVVDPDFTVTWRLIQPDANYRQCDPETKLSRLLGLPRPALALPFQGIRVRCS